MADPRDPLELDALPGRALPFSVEYDGQSWVARMVHPLPAYGLGGDQQSAVEDLRRELAAHVSAEVQLGEDGVSFVIKGRF